jgi:hypothetical protein
LFLVRGLSDYTCWSPAAWRVLQKWQISHDANTIVGIQVGYTIPEEALSHDPPQSTDGNKKQNEALKLAVDIDIYVEGPKNGVEDNNNKKLDKYALGGLDRDSSSSLAYSITLNAPKKRNQYAKDVNKRGFTDEERKMRRQHDFFKDNAYGAVQGHGYLMANLLHITRMLERPGNPSVELQSISFRKSDLSETDWNWLNRLKICHELYHVAERQLISDDHLDIILSQLFPSNRYEVMTGPHFKVFMADFIKEATWCEKALGKKIVELQTSTEELRVGPYVDIQPPVRRVSPNFQALPMVHVPSDPSRDSRLKALAYLVEEMVYECNDWHGIYYEDASGTFSKYYEAWEQTRSGVAAEKLPSDLMEYHRDWTFHEQRLLRAGHLLLDLLRRVNAGVLNVMVYRVIRGTILGIQGQPFAEFDDIESLLYTKTSEPGLEVADIPQILILHPDLGISCPHDEAKHYSGLLANASRFEEEEKARLEDIEQAKQAFAKATGGKSTECLCHKRFADKELANRLSHRIKRRVKKMFGKQQQAPTFHCIGCLQGGCCVGQ